MKRRFSSMKRLFFALNAPLNTPSKKQINPLKIKVCMVQKFYSQVVY